MIKSEAYIEKMFKSLRRGTYDYLELSLNGKVVAWIRTIGAWSTIVPLYDGDMWQVDLTEGDADMTLFFDSIRGGGI